MTNELRATTPQPPPNRPNSSTSRRGFSASTEVSVPSDSWLLCLDTQKVNFNMDITKKKSQFWTEMPFGKPNILCISLSMWKIFRKL